MSVFIRPFSCKLGSHAKYYDRGLMELNKLCYVGNLREVREYVEKLDSKALSEKISSRRGAFGYTPLHEAVASGKAEVLGYLLEKTNGAHINCKDVRGYTPLHLAASSGNLHCVKWLLEYSADMHTADEHGRTPKLTAELNCRRNIVRMLISAEIVEEAENDGDNLTNLLRNNIECLEPGCLNRALVAATLNNNHANIGKLVVKGANNLSQCLELAQRDNKPHARAMLLLIKAAFDGDINIVKRLFGEATGSLDDSKECSNPGFADVQGAILGGNVSTVVAIEIARRNGHIQLRGELLLRTDVNRDEGYVYWHGLRLLHLETTWLKSISWVKRLRLARNGFKTLPDEMGRYLKQVVKIDLQHNELSKIPPCLLELPSLGELNLSSNKLKEIPHVPEWPPCLTVLDLSFNFLTSLPDKVVAPGIRSLNISHNNFHTVPLCVCSLVTLHSLNLSDNYRIVTLPVEMGRLTMLYQLNLTNLKDLRNPPRNMQRDPQDCIRYLNSKLRRATGFYRMNLMVVGETNRGKTTLVKRIQGKECSATESLVGLDIIEWSFKPSFFKKQFHFRIWDFPGSLRGCCQCFLSCHSLYLLLFNLLHGDTGVEELKFWLDLLALRVPWSVVIIVGTHLDEVPDEQREEIDKLLIRVGALAEKYNHYLKIVEVMPVGLENRIENIGLLKEAIYSYAASYRNRAGQAIMGLKIPASYHALDKQLEVVQEQVRQGLREPIMHAEEFFTMVQQMKLADIQDKEELAVATLFLADVGSLLHYEDRSHNLHQVYFVDPQWLSEMLSRVVSTSERNPFISKGILYSEGIPMLFRDGVFPWKYFEQFLALLDHFEIALPLDDQHILVPSMLPEERPAQLEEVTSGMLSPLFYYRFIHFSSAYTPAGFWSRLLSKVMHSIPEISTALVLAVSSAPTLKDCLDVPGPPGHSLFTRFSSCSEQQHSHNLESPSSTITTTKVGEPDCNSPSDQTSNSPTGLESNDPPTIISFPRVRQQLQANIQLEYWQTGLYFHDSLSPLLLQIEGLDEGPKKGVVIKTSRNNRGLKILGQLADITVSLINCWYPNLANGSSGLQLKVPCFECVKIQCPMPFQFEVSQCLAMVANDPATIECGFCKDDPAKNHTVFLADIIPDLLLHDLDPSLLLEAQDLSYQEDGSSLLGRGGFRKVYRGTAKGKSVAIKEYFTHGADAMGELCSEAKLLQHSNHPCIVGLVGVCFKPNPLLVLEEAPLKDLAFALLRKKVPIQRLTLFRIAAEVAAALRFLHSRGIIYRGVKASNVLLWTLDPASLCHCKISDFALADHTAPMGGRGLQGSKGFIAPEVLHISKRGYRSTYDHRTDIFVFGLFLYQLIARRFPYHDVPPQRIDVSVEAGERPKLQDVDDAYSCYHYLTLLMKKCWKDNPKDRPSTVDIIKTLCLAPIQCIMCVLPIASRFSLRQAVAITPANLTKAGVPSVLHNELWVCCDNTEGAELNIYNSHTMTKEAKHFIKDVKVQCMSLCNNHVWVGSRVGVEDGVVDIFSIADHCQVHTFRIQSKIASCSAVVKGRVVFGTFEGDCISFTSDIGEIRNNGKPWFRHVSEHRIDGIACTDEFIWISHTKCISFLNHDLAIAGSLSQDKGKDTYIGQLMATVDNHIIWSAQSGGTTLTAWDACSRSHSFDIDMQKILLEKTDCTHVHDAVITAILPTLDTIWVGMGTGHIMVFHKEELLAWFHPYLGYVRFLSLIPGTGSCNMVVSGGKDYKPPVAGLGPNYNKEGHQEQPPDSAGALVIWEAFEAKTMCQVKLVEEGSPGFLDTHDSVCRMIRSGKFTDGTCINENSVYGAYPQSDTNSQRDTHTHSEAHLHPQSDNYPQSVDPQNVAHPQNDAHLHSDPNPQHETHPQNNVHPQSDTHAQSDAHPHPQSDTHFQSNAYPQNDTNLQCDTHPQSDAHPQIDPQNDAHSQSPQSDFYPQSDIHPQNNPHLESDTCPQSIVQPQSDTQHDAHPQSDTHLQSDTHPQSDTHLQSDTRPHSNTHPQCDTHPQNDAYPQGDTHLQSDSKDNTYT